MDKFKQPTRPKIQDQEEYKRLAFKNAVTLLKGRSEVLNLFERKLFPMVKQTQRKRRPGVLSRVAKVSDSLRLFDLARVARVAHLATISDCSRFEK